MKSILAKVALLLRIVFVRLRFVAVFVVVGLIVGKWDLIVAYTERLLAPYVHRHGVEEGSSDVEWYCPMHPSVVRADPKAVCPACGMPLAKRSRGAGEVELPRGVLARLSLSASRVQLAGIATSEVGYQALVREVRSVGFITYDERRIRDLSARIAGRVDELFVDFAGARVREGDPLYRIYSPELVTTAEEYIQALRGLKPREAAGASPGTGAAGPHQGSDARGGDGALRSQRLAESSRGRLRLWGIADEDIRRLEETGKAESHVTIRAPAGGVVIEKRIHAGHYVEVGEDPYTLADDSVVWVEVEVFERDVSVIVPRQVVAITAEAYPGETFLGTVAFVAPFLSPETRTLTARVDVPNPDGRLKPGMYAAATIRVPLGSRREVAADAEVASSGGAGAPAKIFVCHMHKQEVFSSPGKCARCGGMVLEEELVPPGGKLVYVCPHHRDARSDKPGACPVAGCKAALEYRVEPPERAVAGEWACADHPWRTAGAAGACPECAAPLRRYEIEQVLAVPASAVVSTGSRQVAFVGRGGGVFEAVEVSLGLRAGDFHQVLRGLVPGDKVVTAGAFLLDAETRLTHTASTAYFGASSHSAHGGGK